MTTEKQILKSERAKIYYQKNKELIKERKKIYYLQHKEEYIAYVKQWIKRNPDKHKRYMKTSSDSHKEYKKVKNRERWQKKKTLVYDHYGKKCACCGESHVEFLTIDHIHGGGLAHRREIGPSMIYQWLIKNNFPDGFRVLCMNCNFALGRYSHCPHGNLSGKDGFISEGAAY